MCNVKLVIFFVATIAVPTSYAIINGIDATLEQIKPFFRIEFGQNGSNNFQGVCCATLISNNTLIGVAHCFNNTSYDKIKLCGGSKRFSDPSRYCQIIPRDRVFYPKPYYSATVYK